MAPEGLTPRCIDDDVYVIEISLPSTGGRYNDKYHSLADAIRTIVYQIDPNATVRVPSEFAGPYDPKVQRAIAWAMSEARERGSEIDRQQTVSSSRSELTAAEALNPDIRKWGTP